MEKTTIGDLKQEIIDTIKGIDKDKLTLCDIKLLADTLSVLAGIRESQTDYLDAILNKCSAGFGYKPTTISDLKGDK